MLRQQVERSGRPVTPTSKARSRKVIAREIFMQEAQKRGLEGSADFKGANGTGAPDHPDPQLFNDYKRTKPRDRR